MADMEQIWEKFFLHAFLGSSAKIIQWFRYFSCSARCSPSSTSWNLAERPPRHLHVPRLQRAQSKIHVLRKSISIVQKVIWIVDRRFEKSEMKGESLDFISGFLLSWIFWNSTLFTFGEIFLFYQWIIETNKQVCLLTLLGWRCYPFPFMVSQKVLIDLTDKNHGSNGIFIASHDVK